MLNILQTDQPCAPSAVVRTEATAAMTVCLDMATAPVETRHRVTTIARRRLRSKAWQHVVRCSTTSAARLPTVSDTAQLPSVVVVRADLVVLICETSR